MIALAALCAILAAPTLPTHDDGALAEVHAAAGAWLVETAEGVVAIDPPANKAEVKSLRARIESLHKPLAAVLLTHAPKDRGASLALLGDGVPVTTLIGLRRQLSLTNVNELEPNRQASYAGAHFVVHDLGAGATASDAVWVLLGKPASAFVGALIREGDKPPEDPQARLEQLERAKTLLYGLRRIYPGRGAPGNYGLLERQRKALQAAMLAPE